MEVSQNKMKLLYPMVCSLAAKMDSVVEGGH